MRKTNLLIGFGLLSAPMYADSFTDGISTAGDSVYSYIPYVQSVCFVLSTIIGIVAVFEIYLAIINNAPNVKKRIIFWTSGSIAMLCMTLSLPLFFDYQESGLLAGDSSYGTGSQAGGDNYGTIDTNIPGLDDKRWIQDADYITINIRGRTTSVGSFLNEVYDHMGAGVSGTYGRTLDYITHMYQSGDIDYGTFNELMAYAGSLPHN